MKTLLICGYFAEENEAEVMAHARAPVEFSANNFQRKLIDGLKNVDLELYVVSAPLIGSYPNASDIRTFRGFREEQNICRYVAFNNVWGVRNYSRAKGLKKAVRFFAQLEDDQKLIVVYCAHTPFLAAAAYAKKLDPRIRICFYVPDLPQYMNLRSDRSWLYSFAKKFDIRKMHKLMECVDSFVLLTEHMKEALPVGGKPYQVVEGIVSGVPETAEPEIQTEREKYIVYTGKMDAAFGVKDLVDAMAYLDSPDYRLVLCGGGDSLDYAHCAAEADPRIMALGQVSRETVAQWQRKASVLVNPRANAGEYTKYSFPSKNIEYLLTGKPVVACVLDGMPECYREFLVTINQTLPVARAIGLAIERAVADDAAENKKRAQMFLRYAQDKLCAAQIAKQIIDLCVGPAKTREKRTPQQ